MGKRNGGKGKQPHNFYKPQGIIQSDINLGVDDFVLCIQTPFQGEMLKKFGNRSIVCMDSTHGTNIYDFVLVTIVV